MMDHLYGHFFILLLISYQIILNSLKTHSQEERHKVLSTCSSHIIVVVLFFVPCIFMYCKLVTNFTIDKSLSVVSMITTPLLNPLIYTMRNSEMKNAMKNLWCRKLIVGRLRMYPLHWTKLLLYLNYKIGSSILIKDEVV
jgi:olfactory receptor